MVAFEIFGWEVYRYGIFYMITFLSGYLFLSWLPRSNFLKENKQKFQGLYHLLKDELDDVFLVLMLGVIVGGRLGHVLFYERGYFSQNLLDIVKINQGGMSFVGGVLGVLCGLIRMTRKYTLTKNELFLFGDMILLVVPLGSTLGRYANSLNQELIGKPLAEIPLGIASLLEQAGLVRVYDAVDAVVRVDTNIIQSLGEGVLLLILMRYVFIRYYLKKSPLIPGLLAGIYLVGYGILRFGFEYVKELPEVEMYGAVSISQILASGMIFFGILLLIQRRRR